MPMTPFPQYATRFVDGHAKRVNANAWPIVFVHVPKTAGTSFTQYLRSHFPGEHQIAPPFFGTLEEIGIGNPHHRLFCGHFRYAQFAQQRADAWFITFLRDPVARIVSQYKSYHNPDNAKGGWWHVLDQDARSALEFAQRATFEEFLMSDHPFIVRPLDNLQTHFLTSHAPDHPEFLTSAISALESDFLFFGITEQFQSSLSLFQAQLDSPRPFCETTHRRNISESYPTDMTDTIRERLDQLIRFDQPLYERASEMFSQRLAATTRSSQRDGSPNAA